MTTRRKFLEQTVTALAVVPLTGARAGGHAAAAILNPRDFGARGDGTTDDTAAFQRMADEPGGPHTIRGVSGDTYLIDTQRAQWTPLDLHTAGKANQRIIFAAGYWYGVRLNAGTVIEDCDFALASTREDRAAHAFACGDPLSRSRSAGVTLNRCRFRKFRVDGRERISQRILLAQSVDRLVVQNCLIAGSGRRPRPREILGPYIFDSTDVLFTGNLWHWAQLAGVFEFSTGIVIRGDRLSECADGFDWDKRCSRVTVEQVTYDRVDLLSGGEGVFEFNGATDVSLSGNVVRNCTRYLIVSVKPDVYDTWAGVLTQSGPFSDSVWGRIQSSGNRVERSARAAVVVGSDWASVPHPGTAAGSGLSLADEYVECATRFDTGADQAVVAIEEGTGLRLNCTIRSSTSRGIFARSSVDGEVSGATRWSGLEIEELGGRISECRGEAIAIRYPAKVVFSGVEIVGCGAATGRSVFIDRPGVRRAELRGTLLVEPGARQIRDGLVIRSRPNDGGPWSLELSDSRIVGFRKDVAWEAAGGRTDGRVSLGNSVVGTTDLP